MNKYELVVLGDKGVGKSALTKQLIRKYFEEEYEPTIDDSYEKRTEIDGKTCHLIVLDTSGSSDYMAIRYQKIKSGEGFLLVFDFNDSSSFESIGDFYDQIRRIKNSKDVPIVLAGNKSDFDPSGTGVDEETASDLAKRYDIPFVKTSAKTALGVEEAFYTLTRKIRDNKSASADTLVTDDVII